MLKAIVNGAEKDIVRIPMIGDDSTYKEGWEIRDQQDRLIWGKNNTLTGVSSISFRGYGIPLKSMGVVGNGQQNGTPAPDAPIMPTFCGERTANLWNYTIKQGGLSAATGTIPTPYGPDSSNYHNRCRVPYMIPIPSDTISLTCPSGIKINFVWINADGVSLGGSGWQQNGSTVTARENATALMFILAKVDDSYCSPNDFQNIMLNAGSTAKPYEPYGYKIPITCAGQTQAVYLGQTQTVRKIKKLVLTGEENWKDFPVPSGGYRFSIGVNDGVQSDTNVGIKSYCSHFQIVGTGMTYNTINSYTISADLAFICRINPSYTLETFKQWLSDQYVAGTPVTIWYVLATPTTGIVNEPLAKISTYADELHSTDAGVSIPTTEGSNTLSIDTTLHPSNIEITGHIKSHTVYVMTYIDYTDMTKSYTIGDVNKVNAFTQRRRCNMLDDGTITAFYGDPTFIEDGSNGQVMVYQQKFYYKVEPVLLDGIKIRKCKYYISDYQLPGYKLHPAFIDRTDPNNLKEFPFVCIGAYEGCLQNGDTYITDDSVFSTSYKLSSIAFTDTATNGVKPSSGIISPFGTIGNYETTASNRGTGWHIENIWITSMNQLMFVIEMCNPNSQTALGSGVTNIPDTPNTANNASLVGSTSSLGNGSGRATTTYSNYNGTTTAQTAADKTAVSYRGMENPLGNIWKWVDGMTIKNTSETAHTPYICKSFAYTRNSTLTNYDMVNVTIPGNGYVTAFGYDPNFDWLFISAETNSSNTGSIRDYLYTTNSGYTCALLGGGWTIGAYAGLFYWSLSNGSSSRYRRISARICYLPQ